jgi:hypothetical protein
MNRRCEVSSSNSKHSSALIGLSGFMGLFSTTWTHFTEVAGDSNAVIFITVVG